MRILQHFPFQAEIDHDDLVQALTGAPPSLEPFSEEVMAFFARLSRMLFHTPQASRFPELKALAFGIRKTEIVRFKEQFEALQTETALVVPRGVIFHIPPSNVDTIFVYSWLFSLLAGNRNLIRLPSRFSPQVEAIISVLQDLLTDPEVPENLKTNTYMVSYGHDLAVTEAFSRIADGRVIWGGNKTVQTIRGIPLSPHAIELTFPDRFSFAVVKTAAFLHLKVTERWQLAEQFFNDAFWFDQMGCSSPRLVVWCGERSESERAQRLFFEVLAEVIREKAYTLETGTVLQKFVFACEAALDRPAVAYASYSNELTVITLEALEQFNRQHCGGGLFFQYFADDLRELTSFVKTQDQTLTYFGFELDELRQLARHLNGRGLDRMVPIGKALTFNRFWDGYDLLQVFTKCVYIEPEPIYA